MFLNRSVSRRIGQVNARLGMLDEGSNTINHELGHLLEELMEAARASEVWQRGFVSHQANLTHDSVGSFAEAVKYMAALWLVARSVPDAPRPAEGPSPSPATGESGALGAQVQGDTGPHSNDRRTLSDPERGPETPGGIDLNPANLQLRTQGTGVDFDLPFDAENLEAIPIDGFTPVIFQITPVTNFSLLLGLKNDDAAAAGS